ncbi:MAG TPA: hypothetical protein VJ853_03100, partial [Thermoanaerobaculia bacterium]|nr:hypothetical protein [Thermoanaerobaculia bacterium]
DDPWFGSRAAGDNMQDGSGPPDPANAQLFPYSYTASEGTTGSEGSHFFQWQNKNLYPWQRLVLFPKIDYTFWKKATRQSRGLKGLYYFQNDGSGNFKLNGNGTAQDPCTWANTKTNNLGPGVYFFDSLNNQNPQNGGPGTLSPGFQWNAACFGGSFLMVGFVYLNQDSYGTTGAGAAETNVPEAAFPGEPFRDVGYPKWNLALNDWDKSCGESSTGANDGNICMSGVGDATFSYQDLNSNGQLDIVTMPAPSWTSYDPGATAHAAGGTYVVKTWKSPAQAIKDYGAACTVPGTNPATDCSEPHEPYLNFIYPTSRSGNITVGWEISNAQTRQPKKTSVTCSPTSPQSDCTSNSYDMDGGIVTDMNTLLDGILYNEGNYDSQGNADYFGSLLIQGTVSGNGTPDVWFDEKLLRGTWAPPGMPRVMVFSEQTDELSQQ